MNWDEYFLRFAYLTALKSKDPSTKIGSVICKDNRIISTGYNGFAIGVHDLSERYNDRDTKLNYIVHSEENAVLSAARNGISTLNTTLYTLALPCHNCCKALIQGGIISIVYHKSYPVMDKWKTSQDISMTMIKETGITVTKIDINLNVIAHYNGIQYNL